MNTPHHTKIRSGTTLVILFILCLTPVAWSQGLADSGKRRIDVATLNLYVGADFSPVLTLDPLDPYYGLKLLNGVAAIYGGIRQSSFHSRADALAREIMLRRPDLVARQEVSLLRRQSPGDSAFGGTVAAMDVDLDYLAILMEALRRQ